MSPITFRVTDAERKRIKAIAAARGLTVSDHVRSMALVRR